MCIPQRHVQMQMKSKAHRALPTPLAGLAVPLSVARRGQRCQRDAKALCATRDQHQPSHVHSTHPDTRPTHPPTPSSILTYPYPTNPFVFIFPPSFLHVDVCVSACWLIGDALCAICNNPPTLPHHHYAPFPLITRVGLTICVPVCSHSDKRMTWGAGGGGGDIGEAPSTKSSVKI